MNWKKGAVLLSLFAAFVLVRCGGDDGASGGKKAENTSQADFENPDGSVTDTNATELMNDALKASQGQFAVEGLTGNTSGGKLDARSRLKFKRAFDKIRLQTGAGCENCFEGSENNITVDLACAFGDTCDLDEDTSCTGAGTWNFKVEGDLTTWTFDNASIDCSDDTEDATLNGTWAYKVLDDGSVIECITMTATIEGESESVDECYYNGQVLISADDGEVVCLNIEVDSTCDSVCADFEDSTGPVKIECAVSGKDDSCPTDPLGITDVSTCTVTRDETCSL